ncbi:hypothetical protein BJ165DRAFT_1524958 [Panaeolus papilionaceus]|nr:hypothetical protein BJ165DRAFT_1524958 [Panaeolus papilionaceus]
MQAKLGNSTSLSKVTPLATLTRNPTPSIENNEKLPHDVLRKIFTEYVIYTVPKDATSSGNQIRWRFQELREVCKDWAIVLKPLLFSDLVIGHHPWTDAHHRLYAHLIDSEDMGPAIRQCVLRVVCTHNHHSGLARKRAMIDYLRLPRLKELYIKGDMLPMNVVIQGNGTHAIGVREAHFHEDRDMIGFMIHHLGTRNLTTLSFFAILDIPLRVVLASPFLEQLNLKESSCLASCFPPTLTELQSGFNLKEFNSQGQYAPRMPLLQHLPRLKRLSITTGHRHLLDIPHYALVPFATLEYLSFAGNLDDFHRLFYVAAAHDAGVELFPELRYLSLADCPPLKMIQFPFETASAECARWVGSHPSTPGLKLNKLEGLSVDQRTWFLNRGSPRIVMFRDPGSILQYLGIHQCSTIRSIELFPPSFDMHDALSLPAWGFTKYIEQLQSGLSLVASTKKHHPRTTRVAEDLALLVFNAEFHDIPRDGTLMKRHARVIRHPVEAMHYGHARRMRDVQMRFMARAFLCGKARALESPYLNFNLSEEAIDSLVFERALVDSIPLREP